MAIAPRRAMRETPGRLGGYLAEGLRMHVLKKVPIWLWFVAGIGLLLLFGETKVSVGNVTVNGQSLGGFSTESKE